MNPPEKIKAFEGMPFISLKEAKENYYYDPYNARVLKRLPSGYYERVSQEDRQQSGILADGRLKLTTKDIATHLKQYPDLRFNTEIDKGTDINAKYKNISEFTKDYISSPGYLERLKREGIKNPEEAQQIRVKETERKLIVGSGKKSSTLKGGYGPRSMTIADYSDPNNPENKMAQKTYGADFTTTGTIAHELSHALASNSPRSPLMGPTAIKNLKQKAKFKNSHDASLPEIKADLDALRYRLTEDGFITTSPAIKNFALPQVFDERAKLQENFQNIKTKYGKDAVHKRVFDTLEDNSIIEHLLNYSQASPKENSQVQNVAYGGPINNMKKKKYAVGGDLQSPSGLDMLSMGLSLVPGWGQVAGPAMGLVSGLVKKQQAQNELRNTVVTGTPGNYATGGALLGILPNYNEVERFQPPVNSESYKVKGMANGGDIPLSNDSVQVQGNPQMTDGNNYNYKGQDIALDHNEVIDTAKDFVYSDIVENPLTGNTFAKDAAKVAKSTGKAEKLVTRNNSMEARNTIKYNEGLSSTYAALQELIKTADSIPASSRKGYATGGPVLPWEGFGIKEFQQFANTSGYVDPVTKKPLTVDNSWGPRSQAAFAQYGDTWAGQLGMSKVGSQYKRTAPLNISNNPQGMSVVNPRNAGQYLSVDANAPTWAGAPKAQNVPVYADTPDGPVDIAGLNPTKVAPHIETMDDRAARIDPRIAGQLNGTIPEDQAVSMADYVPGKQLPKSSMGNGANGHIGDALQGIEVLSKFFDTMSPAEHQREYLDNTPITKQSYDPRAALGQNERNFNNAISSNGATSINMRRALQGRAEAAKINADSQVLSQYDTMNKQATSTYQDRTSNKQRYNNQQQYMAADANSRNRAAKDGAIQNAFTSLGNFGEAMNRKDQAYSSLSLLKELYPDVYDRIINQYNTKKG